MNRRSFLKAMAGAAATAFVVPELIVPERRVFALDRTMMNMPPSRLPGDDTAWVQWHIDNGIMVPSGMYTIKAPVIFREYRNRNVTPFEACRFDVEADTAIRIEPSCSATNFDMGGAFFNMTRTPTPGWSAIRV